MMMGESFVKREEEPASEEVTPPIAFPSSSSSSSSSTPPSNTPADETPQKHQQSEGPSSSSSASANGVDTLGPSPHDSTLESPTERPRAAERRPTSVICIDSAARVVDSVLFNTRPKNTGTYTWYRVHRDIIIIHKGHSATVSYSHYCMSIICSRLRT